MDTNTVKRRPIARPGVEAEYASTELVADPKKLKKFKNEYQKEIPGDTIEFDKKGHPIKPKTMTDGEWEAFCFA
jgi:hypothetical protein